MDSNENLCDLQDSFDNLSTKHFLSPASTRSEYEADYYQQYATPPPYEIPESLLTTTSSIICNDNVYQRTIAIIKPEFMEFKDVVLKKINDTGFSIISSRIVHLTPEQIADFYINHYGSPAFPSLIISMSIGPFLVLSIGDINGIDKWRSLIGDDGTIRSEWFLPISVRSRFGLHVDILNALHGSDDMLQANRENRYFFPNSLLEPIADTEELVKDYCDLHINPTLIKGLVELCLTKPSDPILYLAEWLLLNNPFQPKLPNNIALTPT